MHIDIVYNFVLKQQLVSGGGGETVWCENWKVTKIDQFPSRIFLNLRWNTVNCFPLKSYITLITKRSEKNKCESKEKKLFLLHESIHYHCNLSINKTHKLIHRCICCSKFWIYRIDFTGLQIPWVYAELIWKFSIRMYRFENWL